MYLKFLNILANNILSEKSYIQSGLYVNIAGKFSQDIVNFVDGTIFTAALGQVTRNRTDDGWIFDGHTRYETSLPYAPVTWEYGTIEFVVRLASYSTAQGIFLPSGTNPPSAFVQNNIVRYSSGSKTGQKGWLLADYTAYSIVSVSINTLRGFQNDGVALTDGGSVTLQQSGLTSIGGRASSYLLNGELMAIRAYSRQLSEDEMKFNLSLDKIIYNI